MSRGTGRRRTAAAGASHRERGFRRLAALLTTLIAAAAVAGEARAAQLVTWTTSSQHVDAAKVHFNAPPPGEPARPNALRVNVLLPDGYDGARRFPVLYLLHPREGGYDSWTNAQQGDLLRVAKGFPAIVVMPEAAVGWYANWWNAGRRGEPGWERYHLDELIPLVEQRLRIRPGRRWHAIAGPSMGGQGALFYAAQRPGYFGSAASFSGLLSIQRPEWSAGWGLVEGQAVLGDPTRQRFYWTGHNPLALIANLRATRVYVTVGDGVPQSAEEAGNAVAQVGELNSRAHAEDFVAVARSSGADDVTYVPRPGVHDWPYWRQHLAAAIEWGLFEPVPERPPSWSYGTVAQTGEAWGLRFRFAEPPDELVRFTLSAARRLAAAGSGIVSIDTPDGCSLSAELPFERPLPSDAEPPRSSIRRWRLRGARLSVRGNASDRGCASVRQVARVELAISRRERGGTCRNLRRSCRLGRRTSCRRPAFLPARGTSRWRFGRARLPKGTYMLRSRAVDRSGNVERRAARARNRLTVRLG
jgi:S-formylglutathione hydrolase FrmB